MYWPEPLIAVLVHAAESDWLGSAAKEEAKSSDRNAPVPWISTRTAAPEEEQRTTEMSPLPTPAPSTPPTKKVMPKSEETNSLSAAAANTYWPSALEAAEVQPCVVTTSVQAATTPAVGIAEGAAVITSRAPMYMEDSPGVVSP